MTTFRSNHFNPYQTTGLEFQIRVQTALVLGTESIVTPIQSITVKNPLNLTAEILREVAVVELPRIKKI